MKIVKTVVLSALFPVALMLASSQPVIANSNVGISHSGGTDKCGCHYNRKTGEYHCHTRKQRGGGCPA